MSEKQQSTNPATTNYRCVLCQDQFNGVPMLEAHIAAEHFFHLPYECEHCHFAKFPSEWAVERHHEEGHGLKEYFVRYRVSPKFRERRREIEDCVKRSLAASSGDTDSTHVTKSTSTKMVPTTTTGSVTSQGETLINTGVISTISSATLTRELNPALSSTEPHKTTQTMGSTVPTTTASSSSLITQESSNISGNVTTTSTSVNTIAPTATVTVTPQSAVVLSEKLQPVEVVPITGAGDDDDDVIALETPPGAVTTNSFIGANKISPQQMKPIGSSHQQQKLLQSPPIHQNIPVISSVTGSAVRLPPTATAITGSGTTATTPSHSNNIPRTAITLTASEAAAIVPNLRRGPGRPRLTDSVQLGGGGVQKGPKTVQQQSHIVQGGGGGGPQQQQKSPIIIPQHPQKHSDTHHYNQGRQQQFLTLPVHSFDDPNMEHQQGSHQSQQQPSPTKPLMESSTTEALLQRIFQQQQQQEQQQSQQRQRQQPAAKSSSSQMMAAAPPPMMGGTAASQSFAQQKPIQRSPVVSSSGGGGYRPPGGGWVVPTTGPPPSTTAAEQWRRNLQQQQQNQSQPLRPQLQSPGQVKLRSALMRARPGYRPIKRPYSSMQQAYPVGGQTASGERIQGQYQGSPVSGTTTYGQSVQQRQQYGSIQQQQQKPVPTPVTKSNIGRFGGTQQQQHFPILQLPGPSSSSSQSFGFGPNQAQYFLPSMEPKIPKGMPQNRPPEVPCTKCGKMVNSRATSLMYHVNVKHMRLPLFECLQCGQTFLWNRAAAVRHAIVQHGADEKLVRDNSPKHFPALNQARRECFEVALGPSFQRPPRQWNVRAVGQHQQPSTSAAATGEEGGNGEFEDGVVDTNTPWYAGLFAQYGGEGGEEDGQQQMEGEEEMMLGENQEENQDRGDQQQQEQNNNIGSGSATNLMETDPEQFVRNLLEKGLGAVLEAAAQASSGRADGGGVSAASRGGNQQHQQRRNQPGSSVAHQQAKDDEDQQQQNSSTWAVVMSASSGGADQGENDDAQQQRFQQRSPTAASRFKRERTEEEHHRMDHL